MTDTISRPAPSSPTGPPPGARPGLLRVGLPAAAWAAAAGLVTVAVPVLLLWAADSRSAAGAGQALRLVAQVWLLAHGAALHVPGGQLGLVPLGLLALPLLLLARAARHAAGQHEVHGPGDAVRLAAAVAGPYALAVAVVADISGSAAVRADPARALLGASVLALAGAGVGVMRGAGLGPALRARVPGRVQRVLPLAAAAVVALVGAGALLVAGSLALHLGRVHELAAASSPGLFGGAGLLLLGVVLAPTAAVWGACFLAGPGFAVGVGTGVGPFGVTLGAVPALPVLGALPGTPLPAAVGILVLLVPCGAGLLVARLAERRGAGTADALLAGGVVGLCFALLAALCSGALGGGRLAEVGPSWWRVGLSVAVEVSAGVLAWWGVRRLRARQRGRAAAT
ncbi:MAG TPA: DUF6350 family protein [Mycobacteriales bacterium]|jgi:hypothetical protein|nr:DUF6350 family protein [Mycobacteriales bacterium]